MLDFSKATRRRRVYLPSGVKLFFLLLPWVFVAYGVAVSQEFVGFYNNSVVTSARVVFVEPTTDTLEREEVREMLETGGTWPLPSYVYQHENGRFYMGQPISDPTIWRYHPGELVEIRYNRTNPSQAQPVNFIKFWWSPGVYVVGGIVAFVSMLLAFHLAENPGAKLYPNLLKKRKPKLHLRRK